MHEIFTFLPEWAAHAVIDSLKMLPFLVFIFFVVEFIEFYFSEKIEKIMQYSRHFGPIVGAILASIPQCGFSVIAAGLYTRNIITTGTLLAVFLSTSDEAIPILLSTPDQFSLVARIIQIKIIIAIIAGYLIDLAGMYLKNKKKATEAGEETGCCNHKIHPQNKRDLFIHPLKHSLNVFIFILIINIVVAMGFRSIPNLDVFLLAYSVFQPVASAIVGLIPNCSVSIAMVLLYLKGVFSFGALISGLCASAGVGLLVLIKKNSSLKDTLRIIFLLALISIICGMLFQFISVNLDLTGRPMFF